MHAIFWIFHVALVFTVPLLLVVSIPFHAIYYKMSNNSKDLQNTLTKLAQHNTNARSRSEYDLSGYEEEAERDREQADKDKKWETAKLYLSPIKNGLEHIQSQISDNPKSQRQAEAALRSVFFEFGTEAIDNDVLSNIVEQTKKDEAHRQQASKAALDRLIESELSLTPDHFIDEEDVMISTTDSEISSIEKTEVEISKLKPVTESELIEKLYEAVRASRKSDVVSILAHSSLSKQALNEHSTELISIAKGRGDRQIKKLFQ